MPNEDGPFAPPSFNDMFNDDDVSGIVGTAEAELRKSMGDEHFDRMIHYQIANADNEVALMQAQINRVNNVSRVWGAVETGIKASIVLTVAWSVYRWVFGRFPK